MSNVRTHCFDIVNVSTRTGATADGSTWREFAFRAADGSAFELTGFAAPGWNLEIMNHDADAGADVNAADVARAVETVSAIITDVQNSFAYLPSNETDALQTLVDFATAAIDADADADARAVCPVCGCVETEGGTVSIMGATAEQLQNCCECGAEWFARFALTSQTLTRGAKGEKC